MGRRSAHEVFDDARFLGDVRAYMDRRGYRPYAMARVVGVDGGSFCHLLSRHRPMTLFMACKLAVICDLDLNVYNLETL